MQELKTDMVHDLNKVLTGYLERLNLRFNFNNQEVFIDEMLKNNSLTPFLVYNKQEFLNDYLIKKGLPNNIIIFLENSASSIFGFTVAINHDIKNETIYQNMLFDFAQEILSTKEFVFKDDKVHIDYLYEKFIYDLISKDKQNIIAEFTDSKG